MLSVSVDIAVYCLVEFDSTNIFMLLPTCLCGSIFLQLISFGQGNEDLVVVHDALEYGACRLSLAVCICFQPSAYFSQEPFCLITHYVQHYFTILIMLCD